MRHNTDGSGMWTFGTLVETRGRGRRRTRVRARGRAGARARASARARDLEMQMANILKLANIEPSTD